MPVHAIIPGQQPIQGGHHVRIRARAELQDREAGGRVRDEDGQQSVATVGRLGDERGACRRQVPEPAFAAGPDLDLACLHAPREAPGAGGA
jgi:hypothetical protein